MSQRDRLPEIASRVRRLDDRPVAEHPDALEAVHRDLVAEVDALARGTFPEESASLHDDEPSPPGSQGESGDEAAEGVGPEREGPAQ